MISYEDFMAAAIAHGMTFYDALLAWSFVRSQGWRVMEDPLLI